MNGLVDVVMRWWQLPDQFHSFSRHLEDRGFLISCRALVGGTAFWMGLVLLSARFSDVGPQGTFWRAVNLAVIALCLGAALIWWLFPPTPLWSYTFGPWVPTSRLRRRPKPTRNRWDDSSRASFSRRSAATSRSSTIRNSKSVTWSSPRPSRCFRGGLCCSGQQRTSAWDWRKISVVLATIIVIPVVSQIVLAVLGSDATTSDIDPLTGLLNRRGLARRVNDFMGAPVTEADALLEVVIDLDRFKTINDVHGHDVGDQPDHANCTAHPFVDNPVRLDCSYGR